MRHKVYGNKHLLFRNLVRSLLVFETIKTTQAKAKAVKGLVDKIISQAKSPATRFLVSRFISDKKIEERLVKEILPRLKGRNSGFTSIVRLGKRLGDGAMLVQMSLLAEKAKKEISDKRQGVSKKEIKKK